MPQTPASHYKNNDYIDYTPGAAVTAGTVVVQNGIVGIVDNDIAANELGSLSVRGLKRVPKTTAAWVVGLPVSWDPTGTPDAGDVSSGAANQLGQGTYMGRASIAAATGDDFGFISLNVTTNLISVSAVTAAGSVIGDAGQLGQGLNIVTGADGTKGVILPSAVPGMVVYVKGVTAGVLKVYPKAGAIINALSASAAISLATGAVPATFIASTTGQWYTFPLVPS